MTVDSAEFINNCAEIFSLRLKKKEIEDALSQREKAVKEAMKRESLQDAQAGNFKIHLKVTAPTMIVDTAKLKKDGLFEKYSKERAGSTSLMVTESKLEG